MKILIRKKISNNIFIVYMNNIIDTFHINKSIIQEDEILNYKNKSLIESDNSNDLILKKKRLIEMTNNLTKIEYIEILNIIQEDNCSYSSNSNGVFINLTNVENHTIDKIFDFLKFTKHKKEELKEKEIFIESFKDENNDNNKLKNINNNKTIEDDKSIDTLSDNNDNTNYNDYLCFSSDEEDNKTFKK